MTIPAASQDWTLAFPPLRRLDEEARRLLLGAAHNVVLPAGTVLFQEGSHCESYMLVLEGSVRVQKLSETGREIVLYRVERGQSCVLTTSCLMTREDYGAEGIAETEIHAVMLPAQPFRALLAQSDIFRDFVFAAYASRIAGLLLLIEEVAFGRIDARLAQWLLTRGAEDGQWRGTHQDLAVELGTAREVVSRQLKEFERRGWVSLFRGRIDIIDKTALADLARRGKA